MSLVDQVIETWAIHNRINLYLLESIAPEHLANVGPSKGRSVGEQFAHLHNVRLMWLKAAAPDLLEGLQKLEKEQARELGALAGALAASSERIARLARRALEGDGRIKGFKPHAAGFLGYLISHESHHRGQILLTLKQTGAPADKKVAFGLWEWGVR